MNKKIILLMICVLILFIGCDTATGPNTSQGNSVNDPFLGNVEGYNKSSVLKHPKIQLKEQKDETV